MSILGKLYRGAKEWAEPEVYPCIREAGYSEALNNKRVLALGNGRLADEVAQMLENEGCTVERSATKQGSNMSYDIAVVCAELPPLLAEPGNEIILNNESMASLRDLYFSNQAACRILSFENGAIVDIIKSDGSRFWHQEIVGLTRGVANAMATSHIPVNAIHLIGPEDERRKDPPNDLHGLRSLISLWLSDVGYMSSGNVFEVDCGSDGRWS